MTRDAVMKLRAMTKNVRTSTTILLWVFSIFAIGLFAASFVVPPTGVIDGSILKAAGIIFDSVIAFQDLMNYYIWPAYQRKEEIWITIE